ncbi:hypothetical protein DPMN_140920 [Dreissena polymorpha]|uniref:Uncharacterized protein n=1 Tax=Dreissena polymorpha TaxID=45954 RepID=A0A9D4GBR2_DREPO|nr:hypothetical protein DPMN_140920 [Dreissena polymorpha]
MPMRDAECLGGQTRLLGDKMIDSESTPRTQDGVCLRGSRNMFVFRELYCTFIIDGFRNKRTENSQ